MTRATDPSYEWQKMQPSEAPERGKYGYLAEWEF